MKEGHELEEGGGKVVCGKMGRRRSGRVGLLWKG